MQSISLASALTWRKKLTGDHPLFRMKMPAGSTETARVAQLRARAARYDVKPTPYSMTMLDMGVLCTLLEQLRPDIVVEFGCGVSTELLLALQAAHGYPRRILSFDQSADYIAELQTRLGKTGGTDTGHLQIVHAPLVDVTLGDQTLRFYDPSVINDTLGALRGAVPVFLVDGPSGGDWNRLLAGMVAAAWGAQESHLVLHDAMRDWELCCATVWETLGLTDSTRVFPYGHGILHARVRSRGLPQESAFSAEFLAASCDLPMKGDTVSLADAMEGAKSIVCHGGRKRVPVAARALEKLPANPVFSAPDQRFRLQQPRNVGQLDDAQRTRLHMRDSVQTLQGGKLWRLGGVVLTGKSQILCGDGVVAENMEGEYSWQGLVRRGKGWDLEIDRDLDIVERPTLIIEKHGVRNYALWWMEVLPRVYFAYHLAPGAPRHILLNESAQLDEATRRFHEETLRLVAGDDVEIRYATRDTLVMDAWLPNVSHFSRSKTRWNAHTRAFRDAVLSACAGRIAASPWSDTTHRKLFVMRQDSHARRLSNPEALLEALGKRHFFPVTPGELAWTDQIALFSRAHVVAGVHGAGLLNLMWCASGTHVVEAFTPPTLNRNTFRHIASQLDLPYWVYVENETRVVNNQSGSDTVTLDLDIARFLPLLDKATAARRRERGWWPQVKRRLGYRGLNSR